MITTNSVPEQPTEALRYNNGKPEWSLVHFKSLLPMVRVLEYGANKYTVRNLDDSIRINGRNNWQSSMPRQQILDCMMRHLSAIMDGEENDPESGEPHIGHVMCNAMFYGYHFAGGKRDDPQAKSQGVTYAAAHPKSWDGILKEDR